MESSSSVSIGELSWHVGAPMCRLKIRVSTLENIREISGGFCS